MQFVGIDLLTIFARPHNSFTEIEIYIGDA